MAADAAESLLLILEHSSMKRQSGEIYAFGYESPRPQVLIGENVSTVMGSKQHGRRFLRTVQGSGDEVLIIRVCHVSIVDVLLVGKRRGCRDIFGRCTSSKQEDSKEDSSMFKVM
jgi:hypothetical protein